MARTRAHLMLAYHTAHARLAYVGLRGRRPRAVGASARHVTTTATQEQYEYLQCIFRIRFNFPRSFLASARAHGGQATQQEWSHIAPGCRGGDTWCARRTSSTGGSPRAVVVSLEYSFALPCARF